MQKPQILLNTIGKLVVSCRSTTMDQSELGMRVGVGRNTISSIENGKPVNAETLFKVLDQLDIIDDLQIAIEQRLNENQRQLYRKARKTQPELDNDF